MARRPPLYYGWVIVATAVTGMIVIYGIRHSFSVFFPSILDVECTNQSVATVIPINMRAKIARISAADVIPLFSPTVIVTERYGVHVPLDWLSLYEASVQIEDTVFWRSIRLTALSSDKT